LLKDPTELVGLVVVLIQELVDLVVLMDQQEMVVLLVVGEVVLTVATEVMVLVVQQESSGDMTAPTHQQTPRINKNIRRH